MPGKKRRAKAKSHKRSFRDRREYPRLTLSGSVSFRIRRLPPASRMIRFLDSMRRGSARDISRGGVCVVTRQLLPPDTVLELYMPDSTVRGTRHVAAKVVWLYEFTEGRYRVGLKFI